MSRAKCVVGLVFGAVLLSELSGAVKAQTLKAPTVSPAIDGVLAAFESHPLVGLGDAHGMAQEEDFYAALVCDPRFARDVGNVVVEFGGAAHQGTIDRYVNGEAVSYKDLRKVWTDVVGWNPTVTYMGYANFFAQVRAANLALPRRQRIHVWLGEPPIDWSKIKTTADWLPILRTRDGYAAHVIDQEILAKNKKALVIYGTLHFYPGEGPLKQLKELVEQKHPNAFFVVTPYVGFNEKSCTKKFEQNIRNWPIPALATPVRGSSLENELLQSGCSFIPPGAANFAPTMTGAQREQAAALQEDEWSGVAGNALLFLGPSATLTRSPIMPDLYLDPDYRQEISRRRQIITGQPLPNFTVGTNPATTSHFHY